jgi:hypothetical protein
LKWQRCWNERSFEYVVCFLNWWIVCDL